MASCLASHVYLLYEKGTSSCGNQQSRAQGSHHVYCFNFNWPTWDCRPQCSPAPVIPALGTPRVDKIPMERCSKRLDGGFPRRFPPRTTQNKLLRAASSALPQVVPRLAAYCTAPFFFLAPLLPSSSSLIIIPHLLWCSSICLVIWRGMKILPPTMP